MFELTQAFISSVFDRSTFIFSLAYGLLIVFKTKIQEFFRPESPYDTLQYKPAPVHPIKLVVKYIFMLVTNILCKTPYRFLYYMYSRYSVVYTYVL